MSRLPEKIQDRECTELSLCDVTQSGLPGEPLKPLIAFNLIIKPLFLLEHEK